MDSPASPRLELRGPAQVAAGYVLSPVAGLTALWLLWIMPNTPWPSARTIWALMVVIGGAVCLVVELILVPPLLAGYQRHGWRWLNGWSAVAIAFAVGALCSLAWDALSAILPGTGSEYGQYNVAYMIDGVRTAAGWKLWRDGLGPSAASAGMVGGVSALVFRFVAFRTEVTGL